MAYKIAETETFQKKLQNSKYSHVRKKLIDYVYPILRENPFFGPQIKKLKGTYKEIYRYRIGYFRLFYTVSEELVIVFIIDIELKKDSYR